MNSLKLAGKIILVIGIATLLTGIALFILLSTTSGFWTIVASILINVIGISLITKKD